MWRSVSGPSDSPCPQAVINYRHVSSAQTPPSLPPLYDTGCIIILTSNNNNKKNASAILVLEEFSPLAFCQPPLSGISAVETSTECTKFTTEKSTLVMNVLVFSVRMSWIHRELTDNIRLVESIF